jgi:hypothetical protein
MKAALKNFQSYIQYVVYAFALMLIYGIDISSQIEHQVELTQGALSSKVSGVTEFMCAVDSIAPTVALEAVNTLLVRLSAASKHFTGRAWLGRKALDIAKNHL